MERKKGVEWKEGTRERVPDRASWDALKRIRNWYLLASISRGLISSITEFRPTGTELSIRVRTPHIKGGTEKNAVIQCTICVRSWWNVRRPMRDGNREIEWQADPMSLTNDTGLVVVDRSLPHNRRNRQLIIHHFSRDTNIARCPTQRSLRIAVQLNMSFRSFSV